MFFLKLNSLEENNWYKEGNSSALERIEVSSVGSRGTYFINEHELVHDGKLYDVKHKESKGDAVVCYCERDGNEEELLASFDVHTKNCFSHTATSKTKTPRVVKLSVFEKAAPPFELDARCASAMIIEMVRDPFLSSVLSESFFVPPDAA